MSKPRMKSHKNLSNNISIEDSATTSVLMAQLRTFTRQKNENEKMVHRGGNEDGIEGKIKRYPDGVKR